MRNGYAVALVGANWGDEGKGKITDEALERGIEVEGEHVTFDIAARGNGGANAGHTLVTEEGRKIVTHQLPSAVLHPDKISYIGGGCVLNPVKLLEEIADVGVDLRGRLFISSLVPVVGPHHFLFDHHWFNGKRESGKTIGTTASGIGAAYAYQAFRANHEHVMNWNLGMVLDNPEAARKAFIEMYFEALRIVQQSEQMADVQAKVDKFLQAALAIRGYVNRDNAFMAKQLQEGKNVLLEGAQSIPLSKLNGPIPYVTSSNTEVGALAVGAGVPVRHIRSIIGITRAIVSRVGNGPFPGEFGGRTSEEYCAEGEGKAHRQEIEKKRYEGQFETMLASADALEMSIAIRNMIGNFGSTSGKPRRAAPFDTVLTGNVVTLEGIDRIVINLVDTLEILSRTRMPGAPVITSYIRNGKETEIYPETTEKLYQVEPVIEYLPHVTEEIRNIREYSEMPTAVKHYVDFIQDRVGAAVGWIGTGPGRNDLVRVR